MNNFTIQKTETIKTALEKIESNGDGIICIVNQSNKLIGIATDGDIRRKLLDGITLDKPISSCMNASFISASSNDSRETLLKLLDNGAKAIPLVDDNKVLMKLINLQIAFIHAKLMNILLLVSL